MTTIKLKKNSTPGEAPSASDLEVGEVAVNTADGLLYTKHTDNSIKSIGGGTADQTAAEILTAIKTVDGAGSGLDADTLDGIASADIARKVWYSSSVGSGTATELEYQTFLAMKFCW